MDDVIQTAQNGLNSIIDDWECINAEYQSKRKEIDEEFEEKVTNSLNLLATNKQNDIQTMADNVERNQAKRRKIDGAAAMMKNCEALGF